MEAVAVAMMDSITKAPLTSDKDPIQSVSNTKRGKKEFVFNNLPL